MPALSERSTRKERPSALGPDTNVPRTSPRGTGSGRTRERAASTAASRSASTAARWSRALWFATMQTWAVRRGVESASPCGFGHRLLDRVSCKHFRAPWLRIVFFFHFLSKDSLVASLILETLRAKTSFESDGSCLLGKKMCVCVGRKQSMSRTEEKRR